MLCCLLPLLLIIGFRRAFSALGSVIGVEFERPTPMPPAAHRTVAVPA